MRTNKKFLLVQTEGQRKVKRNIDHYNLDIVIAVGYRVQSQVATRFRRWATVRLHEYIHKGFTIDDERLKQGAHVILGNFYREFEIFDLLNAISISKSRIFMQLLWTMILVRI